MLGSLNSLPHVTTVLHQLVVIVFVIRDLHLVLSIPLDEGMALQVLKEHTINLIMGSNHIKHVLVHVKHIVDYRHVFAHGRKEVGHRMCQA